MILELFWRGLVVRDSFGACWKSGLTMPDIFLGNARFWRQRQPIIVLLFALGKSPRFDNEETK
jgi:hypothetical protein